MEDVSGRVVMREICAQIVETEENERNLSTFGPNCIGEIKVAPRAFVALPKSVRTLEGCRIKFREATQVV